MNPGAFELGLFVGSIDIRVYITGKRFMRCGRILVEGEAEEIALSPRPRFWQRHGKKSNPFSSRGLEKFETVYAELSAKREYIAKKTGVPEDQVRFAYSKNGWTPVVMRTRDGIGKKNSGEGAAGVSIPRPVEKNNGEKDGELRRKDEGHDSNGKSESISISVFDERSHSLVMPWSRFLKATAFGLFGLSAMWERRSGVPSALTMAAAMTVGGVMCMKKFILSVVSSFAALSRNPRNSKTTQDGGGVEAIAEQKDVDKVIRRIPRADLLTVSAPCSPVRAHVQSTEFSAMASPRAVKMKDEHKHHHHNNSKAKKIRRIISMDNRPTRSLRPQGSDIFYRRTRPAMAYDASVGAASLIIALFCLAFYGRLYAIFFTSAWWYLLPMFCQPSERINMNNNNSKVVDHQSNQNKKKAIMDGLLGRR